MGRRSRSRSPRRRDRDRDRHRRKRSRDRSRDRDRRRHSEERDNHRRYSRSRSRSLEKKKSVAMERPVVTAADLEGKSPEEQEMMKMMGFCNFDTTKGKKVDGNEVGDVHVILKRKYRQYMNRKGGFNRPLDFVA